MPRGPGLHEGSGDNQHATRGHAHLAASKVRNRTTEEETSEDGADGVGRVDRTDHIWARIVEVGDPVIRALYRVVDRGIVSV